MASYERANQIQSGEMLKLNDKIRSFISIEITEKKLLERLLELQQQLSTSEADLKLVQPQNVHFTLRFLGEISSSTLEAVQNGMAAIKFNPFKINLSGVGVFPNLNRISVVWVGVTKGEEEVRMLSTKIESSLKTVILRPDSRGFTPHLTVARVRTGRNKDKLVASVKQLKDYVVGSMEVNTIRLKKSILTPKGPIYSTIFEVLASG
jgi:2'-5' RNA ligase